MQGSSALPRPGLGLALLAAAQFVIAVDYNIVYVALPSIAGALGFSAHGLQWVISAYALAFGGFMLLGGRLGDVVGRRRAFITAMLLYAVASLAGGFARGPATLIAARAVQGLGGALLFPTTLSLLTGYFSEGPARNRALSVLGGAGASGGASGALLGGVLTSAFGWSWTLFVNVPIAIAAAALALVLLPVDERCDRPSGIDVPGAATGTTAVTLLVLGCIRGPELGWRTPSVIASLVGALASLLLFLRIEARSKAPLMPLRLLGHPTLVTAMVVTGLFGAAFGAQYYLLTTYLQTVLGFAPSRAGLAFLPFAIAIVIGTRIGGRLVATVGLRSGLVGSLLVGIAGQTFLATRLTPGGAYASHVLAGLVIDGIGQGSTWTLMWIAATTRIDAADRGIASGMASSAQQIGAALGLALLVGVATSVSPLHGELPPETLVRGLRAAFVAAAVMGASCAIFAFRRVRGR